MQIRLKLTSIFVASKSPKLHFHRRSVFSTLFFFGICAGGRCHLRCSPSLIVSLWQRPPFRERGSKKKGKGRELLIDNCALYQTNSSFTDTHSPIHPPRECVTRFLYPLTNIRISPLINRGYRTNAYRTQFLIRALLIRSEIWELCCCLISDPPVMLLATDTKATDASVIALLQTCFLVLTFSLRVSRIDKITRISYRLSRSITEDGKV